MRSRSRPAEVVGVVAHIILRSLLFGVAGADPFTCLALAVVLTCATVFACWRLAWQASRQSILATLRLE